ncbi:heme-degrading oxygenase HmoB [Barrientosiimonas marina]|uniref:Antibiotic biosynthesis monooxygenase family protein n=1 Tax=Lentibacillus kimchii TaxID=1542911 RepID=A0ABW2UQR8_9BACI
MNAYMTNGTYDFLQKLPAEQPSIDFFFMHDNANTLVYCEGNFKKNVFAAGRSYEAVTASGDLNKSGFVVMNNIPVSDDGKALFEDKFKQRQQMVESEPGFQCFRLLRPKKGNTYIVMTQWASEADFNNWKNSDQFKQAHKEGSDVKPPAYFLERPFLTSYHMIEENE